MKRFKKFFLYFYVVTIILLYCNLIIKERGKEDMTLFEY